MQHKNILKKYPLEIDFKDYEKRRAVSQNIVYSSGDTNTAFIDAILKMDGDVINLTGCTVAVGIANNGGKHLTNGCEVVDAERGMITIPFTSTALSRIGFNKFEVVVYRGEKKLVSPMFVYRVTESVTNDDNIEGSNDYDVLLVLISQVQGALDSVKAVADRVEGLEQTIITNEEERKANETQRIADENIRLANEIVRQSQESHRQQIFDEKIAEVNDLTGRIETDLNDKIQEVDTELTTMLGIFDERVTTVDGKIQEIEDKIIEVDTDISNKLTQLDKDVEITINTKFDNKMEEVIAHVDSTIDEKTTAKFEEVDATLAQKLAENDKKVNDKVAEADLSIQNVNGKIQEMNETIDRNVKKVDDKISEVNIVKTQLINDVNAKIVEVDTTKNNLTTSIDNKMTEFEDRFSALESANPTGELTQSRISIDGTIHETLSKRLQYDYAKKADKDTVYTKSEIDTKIEGITSVDDSTTSTESTWSSSKINSELAKKETIEGSQAKVAQAVRDSKAYTDEKVANLVGQSPELLDTLEELSSALGNDPNFATTITNQIGQKADKNSVYSKEEVDKIVGASTSIDDESTSGLSTWSSNKISSELNGKVSKEEGKGLSSNDYTKAEKDKLAGLSNYVHPNDENTRHVTDAEKANWNSKADGNHVHDQYSLTTHKHSYSELNDLPNIPSKVSELQNDSGFVTRSDIHTHTNKEVLDKITQEKVSSWDNKSDFSGAYEDLTGLPTIPVVDVNKAYVDAELGKKANSVDTYTKEEVNTLVESATSIDDEAVSTDTTWSSSKINTEVSNALSSIPKNLAYDKIVLAQDWVQGEDGNYYFTITHKLGTSRIFVSAMDNVSREAVLIGYKIVDNTSIIISSVSQMEMFVTIVNGDNQIQASGESDSKKNIAFDQEVAIDDWIMEEGLATVIVNHRLFTEKILVSAISIDTKESLKIAYKVIDDLKVKVSILNPMNALITVLNGEKEFTHLIKEGSEIEDSVVSSGSTWSSKKIQEEISNKVVHWDSIVGIPTEFNPSEHNHNDIYYQKNEVDTLVEPIDNTFIDGLFASPTVKINGVKYYTADEIDAKFNMLVSMIEKISK